MHMQWAVIILQVVEDMMAASVVPFTLMCWVIGSERLAIDT